MARTKPASQRRSDLLDAAESVLLATGVDSFTVDDVTTTAGVAKGTFYLYFRHKDDVIAALRDRFVERFVERQHEAIAGMHGNGRVERWMLAGIDAYLADLRLHDVLFHHHGRPTPTEDPPHPIAPLRDLLAELDQPPPDPEATAVLLYWAMHGAADHIVHTPAARDRVLAELVRLSRAVVAASASTTEPVPEPVPVPELADT